MKFTHTLFSVLAIAGVVSLSGCLRDKCTSNRTYVRFDPIYKTLAECRAGIAAEGPRTLKKPGKIYAIGQYMLITELNEGIHVIDNSNPANPVHIAFWNIPGNVDMAVRDNYLYVDQYIDLLTIDISNLQQPQVVCRAENVFALYGFDPERGYLVDYEQTEVTEDIDCSNDQWGNPWFVRGGAVFVEDALMSSQAGGSQPAWKANSLPASTGIAGSYSRFGQYDNFLYCVDNSSLRPFALTDPSCPVAQNAISIGWNIETIFPWKDRLFVGSQNGVFIFNASNPAQPLLESVFSHATGCDPVVCDEENAYVTIHDGTECRNGSTISVNQLDVIDIRNLPVVSLRKTYPMVNPKGLSVAGKYLYLCDDGLKVFDKENPLEMKQIAHISGIKMYDVIAMDETHLLVVGDDGFYQYDVSDPTAPKEISRIAVTP